MKSFEFYNPTKIVFGEGKTSEIGAFTAPMAKKVMLIYGKQSIRKNGIYDKVVKSLEEAGISFVECSGVKSNPVLSFVKKGIQLFRNENLDGIVAVGGGSVIDTAKAIAAGVYYEGDVWDFFLNKARVEKAPPITVVLTLAATGSEMNSGGVITNEATFQKYNLHGELLFPKVSILDPVNTYSVPLNYSMYGAVDAIIHLLETYFNGRAEYTPIQDSLVEGLVKNIMEAAAGIIRKSDDYNSRAVMMWAASLALNGLTTSGAGAAGFPMHMIEHSLSAIYDIPHGAGLSIVAPAWMRYAAEKDYSKFAQFADKIFGIKNADEALAASQGIKALEDWFRSIYVPVRLQDVNIPLDDIPKIAENARGLARRWGMKGEYKREIIENILKIAAS
ncbi:iron-containing alcohol dehydrogenase [Desulforegula conservatrix]|uniref:iron-containing alcohol dehydrogenase n=1 Tax=Desulforegula conservatrix TaxID=153026 RepID=UPI00040762B2|nr:iron-containing alcohol dehydrogenase [Desulforegula conservatrix]